MSNHCLSKVPYLLQLALLLFTTQSSLAQARENTEISATTLKYYLIQAFEAGTAGERIALNHIGIEVLANNDGFLVTAALEGYPAHLAGIERGDIISLVDGEAFHPVYSFNSIDLAPNKFEPNPIQHNLEYLRRGESNSIGITPVFENLFDSYRSATLDSAQVFSSGNKTVGYLRLWGLSRNTGDLFTLEKLMTTFDNSDGIIVDLRNSYGYLSSRHLDLFTQNGHTYFDSSNPRNRHSSIQQNFSALSYRPYLRPLLVLVNSETRGGAELFAYGLSKNGRVIILGEISAGEIGCYLVSDNSLHYKPAEALLIDGKQFEAIGIIPEKIVPFSFSESTRSDPQFGTALSILLGII
jgi:carboxyl-terminal processing protease